MLLIGCAIVVNYANAQTYNVANNGALPANTPQIGIGTITPTNALQVSAPNINIAQFGLSTAPTGFIKITSGSSAGGSFLPVIDATSTIPNTPFNSNASLPSLIIRANGISDNGTSPLMIFRSAIAGALVTNRPLFQWQQGDGTPKMTMDKDGNVGIGATSTTNAKLKVQTTASNNTPDDFAGLSIERQTTTGTRRLFMVPHLNGFGYNQLSTSGDFGILWTDGAVVGGSNSSSGLVIGTFGSNNGIRIASNGNVGIGTNLASNTYNGTANYFKLSVNGSVRAKEIIVNTNWADFVFEKNYKLKTLAEVEQYINANGHLPEIPTATDIETNGGNLGELVKLQMQKIEELTLYMIEQNKKLSELNEAVQKQQIQALKINK